MRGERVKSIIIATLHRSKVGDFDEDLPPHITVVPPFTHERIATSKIVNQIGEQLENVDPFEIEASEITVPAHNEGKPARRVGSKVLHIVHNRLTKVLHLHHGVDIDTTHALDNYNPHTTLQDEAVLHEAERRTIRSLLFAQRVEVAEDKNDKVAKKKYWYIAAKYGLGDSDEEALRSDTR